MRKFGILVFGIVLTLLLNGCGKDVHYYIELGNQAVHEGDFQQAMLHFEKAVEEYPESYEAHNSLGAALSATGNLPRAVEHFSIAVALKEDFVEGYYNLGRALAGLGRLNEAAAEYQHAIQVDSTFAIAHMGLAEIYVGLNRPEMAVASYERAISNDRRLLQAYIGLGRVYVGMADYDKGIEVFAAARDAFPDDPNLPYIAGKAAILKGDAPLAVEYLFQAVRLDSLNLFYRNDLASAYMLAGRKIDAIEEWESILAGNPSASLREVVERNLARAARED